jgi:hypothetical protein
MFFHVNNIYQKNSKYLFKFTLPTHDSHSSTHEITSPQIWHGLGVDTHIFPLNMVNMIHVVKREVGNKDGI